MLSAQAQAALVQKAHAGLGGDPLVAIIQGLVPHQSPIYSQAAELVQAARGAGTRHKVDPAYLARLLVGISGGEQSYGLSGAPDVGIKNLWGWGHSPDAASGEAFGSWQDAFNTVAEGLAGNYLSKGLVTPEQIAPVYVGTGDHTDWISTVNKALGGQAPQDVSQAPVLNGGSASGASQLPPLSAGITKPEYVTSKPDVAGFLRAMIGQVGAGNRQGQPVSAMPLVDLLQGGLHPADEQHQQDAPKATPVSKLSPKVTVAVDHQEPISPVADLILGQAKSYLGTKYVYGGETPSGFDCSGFVQYLMAQQGIHVGRTTYEQVKEGQQVAVNELQPGDVVFFSKSGDVHHEGLYIGGGQFIHAPHTGDVVKISSLNDPYYAAQLIGGRRFTGVPAKAGAK